MAEKNMGPRRILVEMLRDCISDGLGRIASSRGVETAHPSARQIPSTLCSLYIGHFMTLQATDPDS